MDGVSHTAAPNPLLANKIVVERQGPRADDAKTRSLVPFENSGLVDVQIIEDDKKSENRDEDKNDRQSEIQESIERIRKTAEEAFSNDWVDLQISYNDEADRFIYRSVSRETGEVVREHPPEEVIKMIARLRQIAGIIVDTKS